MKTLKTYNQLLTENHFDDFLDDIDSYIETATPEDINSVFSLSLTHFPEKIINYDIIEKLLIAGADPNQKRQTNWNMLVSPILDKNTKLLELLIKYGADVNSKNKSDQTLLWLDYEHYDVVKVLIDNGIDINHIDGFGNSILFKVINLTDMKTMFQMLDLLIENDVKLFQVCRGEYIFDVMSDKELSVFEMKYPEQWAKFEKIKKKNEFNL